MRTLHQNKNTTGTGLFGSVTEAEVQEARRGRAVSTRVKGFLGRLAFGKSITGMVDRDLAEFEAVAQKDRVAREGMVRQGGSVQGGGGELRVQPFFQVDTPHVNGVIGAPVQKIAASESNNGRAPHEQSAAGAYDWMRDPAEAGIGGYVPNIPSPEDFGIQTRELPGLANLQHEYSSAGVAQQQGAVRPTLSRRG